MRILYVITKSEIGGAQTHLLGLARAMHMRGNSVAVMAGSGGWLENEINSLGMRFYKCTHLSNNLFNVFGLIRSWRTVNQVINDFGPDIISCHSSVAGFITRIAVKGKIPTVFTVHGWGFAPGVPSWRRGIALLAEKSVARYTSKIICVSKYDAQLAIKYRIAKKENLAVIYNGVEIKEKPNFDKFDRDLLEIVFVGRLARPKRPEILLRAFNNICLNEDVDLKLKIIGDGPDMDGLRSLTERLNAVKKIEILGAKSPERVMKILAKTNIFILPSDWESFPMTILEAMSSGNVVVAFDVGGVKEAIGDGAGILIKRGDERALREALENLITHPAEAEKLARTAFAKVQKEFSLEKMLADTLRVYEQALAGNKRQL